MSLMDMLGGGAGPQQPQRKISQEAANYGRGTPTQHCGICDYYEGGVKRSCTRVAGPISGYAISDQFKMQPNPFGSKIGPKEAAMMDSMMKTGPDQSPHVAED